MNFPSTLRELRKEHQVTQEELADHLGITRSAVAGYESKGKQPDFERLILMADYFQVSVDYLLRGDDSYVLSPANESASQKERKILESYHALTEGYKKNFLEYLDYLLMKSKSEKSGKNDLRKGL